MMQKLRVCSIPMKHGTMRARAGAVNLPHVGCRFSGKRTRPRVLIAAPRRDNLSGERRLPGCCRRQLADDNQLRLFRLAAETSTLAACAPRKRITRADPLVGQALPLAGAYSWQPARN